MRTGLIDIAIAIVLLIAGIALVALGERDLGSLVVSTALGYIAGAFRDKPGGLDEAVRLGDVDVEYIESEADNG